METRPFYIMLLMSLFSTAYITAYIAPAGIFLFLIIFPILFSIGKKLYPRTGKDDLKRGLLSPMWFQKGPQYKCIDCKSAGNTKKSVGNKVLRYSIYIVFGIVVLLLSQKGQGTIALCLLLIEQIVYYSYSTEVFICNHCGSKK